MGRAAIGAWGSGITATPASDRDHRLPWQRRAFATSLHNLASLYRQPSPRSPVPPTSFPSGLRPVGQRDVHGRLNHRVSRTDLDFEQALRAEGTFLIKESLDIDNLGVLDTSNASFRSLSPFSSPEPPFRTPHTGVQPATPTVVPPTPSSGSRAAGPSSLPSRDSTSSSSGQEIFYDAQEDTDLQTKRRSMYRSPGTASSPDLATLLRKSKHKDASTARDGRFGGNGASAVPLTPNRFAPFDGQGASSRDRQRSVTSTVSVGSPQGTPGSKSKSKGSQASLLGTGGIASPDWVLTSPRSLASMRDSGISKVV